MRQRWYDAQLQRFISTDPIGLYGGANLYGYCGNNPINAVDPMGLQDTGIGTAMIGGARAVLSSFNSPTAQQAAKNIPKVATAIVTAGEIGTGAFVMGAAAAAYAGRNNSRPTDPQFPGDPPNGNWNASLDVPDWKIPPRTQPGEQTALNPRKLTGQI